MKTNALTFGIGLVISGAFLGMPSQALALDSVQEQSTVTEKTTSLGDPTIIEHINSKMEPTVVQSRTTTDAATGEREKVVEPIIMERHDKVMDTTIVQPQVTEVRKTTQQVITNKETVPVTTVRKSSIKNLALRKHFAHKVSPKTHHVASAQHKRQAAVATTREVNQVTEIISQPSIKETFIQNQDKSAPPEPQVIQKVESK